MVFNSLSFAIFCPIVFALYWFTKDKYKWIILFVASYYFYMSWNVKYVFLILLTTVVSYVCALLIDKTEDKKRKKRYMVAALIICLGTLFVFKYFNFALDNINKICSIFAIQLPVTMINVVLPVGISFYTFQTLSYVIDVYRGDVKAEKHFGKYATFISFFPQLVAGPIERTSNLLPQILNPKKFDYENAAYGVRLMLVGFFKKLVIADNAAILVNYVFNSYLFATGPHLLLAVLAFTFQIYGDFSGYSDIAVGTAKLFNINLMDNFKSPYFATSVKDFWSRWHISLSSWFRDYLYIPLGGNRCGAIRRRINVLIVFLVSGLWHGADWHFVIWGGLQGVAQMFGGKKKKEEKHNFIWALKVFITFCFISLSWVFFRLGISDSIYVVTHLFAKGCSFKESINLITDNTTLTCFSLVVLLISIILLMVFDFFSLKRDLLKEFGKINVVVRCILYAVAIFLILFFMPLVIQQQFIYFQF